MKIAVFSDCYLDLTGGIVSSINAQKKALEDRGHEVVIFSSGFSRTDAELDKLAKKNIFVVPSCRLFFKGLTPVARRPAMVEKWLLENFADLADFDVFYIHYEAGCSIAGLRLARKLGVPSVQVMHGREDMGVATVVPWGLRTFVAGMLNWFHSWYLPHFVKVARDDHLADTVAKARMWTLMVNHANYADMVLTPSEHFRKKLMHYGVSKPVKVMPNGYPDDKFPAGATVRELHNGETLRMIWHSRVQGEKRIMPFLKALKIVQDDTKPSEGGLDEAKYRTDNPRNKKTDMMTRYTLDVYGDGTELKKAQKYAKRHELPVKFHEDVPFEQLRKVIGRAHLDVMASYNYDTFGMTLIEAEAYGTPVFFCDPDMKDVVPAGGYVLSSGPSVSEMAEALVDLMAHPERVAKMSEVMIRHREEVLVSKRIVKLEKIFHRVNS